MPRKNLVYNDQQNDDAGRVACSAEGGSEICFQPRLSYKISDRRTRGGRGGLSFS